MNKEVNMEKLKDIDELLSYIPVKSIDEFANVNKNKKKNDKINTNHNLLSLNEISNKLKEKINNFQTNKGKKRTMQKPKGGRGGKGENSQVKNNGINRVDNKSNSKNKNINKSKDLMETD